jgi:lipopolysaccharide transport system ATP-binding protein
MRSDDIAISVRHLTKRYRLFGHPGDRVKQFLSLGLKQYHRDFTALEDVSFDIRRGETVGIIGRNGSGKSTLLQLVCGILKPSAGTVQVNGRVSALLELGAGFNPEFTGRENVYFQGALMGFDQAQMDARFEAIAAFADIGEFIDQPVRTYSSGMFVRLAFSTAIHVDAEILVIDEALAVGDIAFQVRCFDRIRQLKQQGVTILLVSHSMPQILASADKAVLLDSGCVVAQDKDVATVVAEYESRTRITSRPADAATFPAHSSRRDIDETRFGTFEATISDVSFLQNGLVTTVLQPNIMTELRFHIEAQHPFKSVVLGVSLRKPGTGDLWGDNNLLALRPLSLHVGSNIVKYAFELPLTAGEYLLHCGLADISGSERVELDQRWPAEKVTVVSERAQVGVAHGPITVIVET